MRSAAADVLQTWQARLAKKQIDLDPKPATVPEKKEGPKAEKEAAPPPDKADSSPPKEDPKTAPEKKDAKSVDAKTTDTKTADAKTADAKTADMKTADAKTASGEKPSGDAKGTAKEDGKLEPTDAVISLDKTDGGPNGEGLDQRQFRRKKYLLARANVVEGGGSSDFMSSFDKGLFQPTMASATDDHYLFWKIKDRPTTLLSWEQPGTKEKVLAEYRKYEARELALKHAGKLAADIRRESKDFPTGEVLRLFRGGKQDGKLPIDRSSLSLSAAACRWPMRSWPRSLRMVGVARWRPPLVANLWRRRPRTWKRPGRPRCAGPPSCAIRTCW